MTKTLSIFLNATWLWLVLIASLVLVVVFVWKELKSPLQRGKWLRCVLAVIAIGSLAAIALRPTIAVKATTQTVMLTTHGFTKQQRDSLLDTHPNLKVLAYEPGSAIFPDDTYPEFVYVIGFGVAPFDLWQLDGIPATFLNTALPKRIVELSYDHRLYVGEELVLAGGYNEANLETQLILQGPDGIGIDSLLLEENTRLPFTLSAPVKVAGNYVYHLVEKDETGTMVTAEPIPVTVLQKEPLSISIINTFPSFETKYLKNFLGEEGHLLSVRSQITRGRYKYEYFNQDNGNSALLSQAALKNTDLLILDVGTLRRLSSSQKKDITNAIQAEGLGLLVQPEPALFSTTQPLFPIEFERAARTFTTLEQLSSRRLPSYAFRFKDDFRLESIHSNSDNRFISAIKRNGKGSIGTTLLERTYELQLGGQQEVYKKLWSDIISKLSKKKMPLIEWSTSSMLAYEHEPYDFRLRTLFEQPQVVIRQGSQIPLVQDRYIPTLWEGTVYPRALGWNKLQLKRDSINTHSFYTVHRNAWEGVAAAQTMAANKRFLSEQSSPEPIFIRRAIDVWWWYILFLLSMGYLWLVPKWSE